MIFFDLLSAAFSCVCFGFLATLVVMAILYVVLRQMSRGIVVSIGFYVSAAVLTLMLFVQLTMTFGAIKAKGYVDSIEADVSEMVEGVSGVVSSDESKQIVDELKSENRLFAMFMDNVDFEGNDVVELPHVIAQSYRDYLNSCLWNRFWWIVGSMVVAITVMVLTRKRSSMSGFDDMGDDPLDCATGDSIEDSLYDTDIY